MIENFLLKTKRWFFSINRKQSMQLKLLIFKIVLVNGIIGMMPPVYAHPPNETLEQWEADLEVNQLLSQG